MKKVFSFFVVIMLAQLSFSQGLVKGVVVDKATNEALVGVTVQNSASGTAVSTSLDGSFAIKVPAGKQELKISYIGYSAKVIKVSSESSNLGQIGLESEAVGLNDVVVTSSVAIQRKTPVALSVVTPEDIQTKLSTQEFPEILKSTPSVYATKGGGGYGDSRINIRGFSSENIAIMINGVPMNDMEWGGTYWSNWAGLSDVTRSLQVQRGLGASKIASPSVGGLINIVTKSTEAQKGGSAYYGIADDGFQKMSFSVSTGLDANGWAVSLLGAKTSGDGYIKGTQFEGYTAFLAISKVINENQQISFNAFMAPQGHNQRKDALTIDEWKKYGYRYNADWGYDINGQGRTFNYNYYNKPQMSLNHYLKLNDLSSLSTVAYMSIGIGGGWSGLGSNSSYAYGSTSGLVNQNYRKIDGSFDYATLMAQNAASQSGSQLAIRDLTNNHLWYGLLSTYDTKVNDFTLQGGIDIRYYKGTHQGRVVDLLGGQYVIDPARASGKFSTDLNWVTQKLSVGDIIYRDYDGYVQQNGVFGQAEYNKDKLNAFFAASASNTNYWRVDRFYYDNVQSQLVSKYGFSAKGGANYNIDNNSNVFANIGYFSRTPFFQGGVFSSYTTSNIVNTKAVNEKVFSTELGYGFRSKYFSGNVNLYRTEWKDKTMVKAINSADPSQGTINLTGVNSLRQGIELDFKVKPFKGFNISGMFSWGDWRWDSNASGYVYNESGQPVDSKGNVVTAFSPTHAFATLNLKGIPVGNAAQTTASLEAKYELLKGFNLGAAYTFYARNYADFSLSIANWGDNNFGKPWVVPVYGVMDMFMNYEFPVGKVKATLFGNINNLLNSTYISDATDLSAYIKDYHDVSVYYGFGTTWSVGLKVNF